MDKDRVMPLVPCQARTYTIPCDYDTGSDADWEQYQKLLMLANELATSLSGPYAAITDISALLKELGEEKESMSNSIVTSKIALDSTLETRYSERTF